MGEEEKIENLEKKLKQAEKELNTHINLLLILFENREDFINTFKNYNKTTVDYYEAFMLLKLEPLRRELKELVRLCKENENNINRKLNEMLSGQTLFKTMDEIFKDT